MGGFRHVRLYVLHGLCHNTWIEKIFVTCWNHWGINEKIFSGKFGMKIAQETNVELNSTKTKNLNEINTLDIGQKCRGFGKNRRMTERYSKPDRRSRNHASVSPSTCSIVWWRDWLIARSIHWMAVQFSGNWVEGKNNFTRWNDEGGGARAMRWLAATGNKPHSPPD